MHKNTLKFLPTRAPGLMMGLILGISVFSNGVAAEIDPEADKIVKQMSSYLNKLPAVSVDLNVDNEVIDTTGRKLQFSASTSMIMKQPNALYAYRQGPVVDLELFSNGDLVTLHGKNVKAYTQLKVSGNNIDALIDQIRSETGFSLSSADLFYSNAYDGLMDGVLSGTYMGTGFVNGVECHHLIFRKDSIDWQLWVQKGKTPLPMKYIVTSKWITAAPQYSVRFNNWNSSPKIDANTFSFSALAGTKQIESISVNSMGDFIFGEAK